MSLPTNDDVVTYQKTTRHTGAKVVVSESIEDTTLDRKEDTGAHTNN